MSEASGIETGGSSRPARGEKTLLSRLAAASSVSAVGLAAFVLGVGVILMHRPFDLPERGDLAIWDYIAQSILRGEIPYRDVIEIKSPGGAYLSALAIAAGRIFGLQDAAAVRLLNVLLIGLLSCVTCLVAAEYLRSRLAAVIAFLVPLLPEHLATMVAGTQPKLTMILFGMLTLTLIAKDRPFWAGVCSMLSCLCWQPGLLFTGTALLVFSRCFVSWRDLRAAKVLTGAAVPLVVLVSYFYLAGALADLWTWTIAFNYSVYGPRQTKGLSQAIATLWKITRQVFRADIVFVALSAAGLVMFVAQLASAKLKRKELLRSLNLTLVAIVIPPLVYLAFCLINFQGGPDLIPLFPFIGIFAGWFFVEAGRLTAGFAKAGSSFDLARVIPGLAIGVIFLILATRSITYQGEPGPALENQRKEFQAISNVLGPEDRIYVHGTMEILVLLGRPNLNPYIMFDEGKDDFVAAKKYGGSFRAILDELGAEAPRIISLSRLRHVTHGAEFERWVLERYEELPVAGYDDIYVRKQ